MNGAKFHISAMVALLLGLCSLGAVVISVEPAQAQFWFDNRPQRPPPGAVGRPPPPPSQRAPFGFPFFAPWGGDYQPPPEARPARPPEATRPPAAARKVEPDPNAMNVVVLGDSMAEWLAFGLEDAFSDSSEFIVARKSRPNSGLIRNEGRDAREYDWVPGARETLAGEKADFVVMMIGLGDRQPIRERQPRTTQKPGEAKPAEAKPGEKPSDPRAEESKPGEKPAADAEAPGGEQPRIMTAEPERPGPVLAHEFRSERWNEIYTKRIDDTIAALKSKRVPVIWVGLPPIRGSRSRAEMTALNDLYRARAERAGITFVDVWEGFVDDAGEFAYAGPDVLGQVRRLRHGDGVNFTKAGARKLAHFVEREILRALSRATPVALPSEPEVETPAPGAKPGGPAPRPLAGPVVPLTGHTPTAEGLLGTAAQSAPPADAVATTVLVKGEAVESPVGRADNFAWPRPTPVADNEADPLPESGATARTRPPSRTNPVRPGQRTAAQPATPAQPSAPAPLQLSPPRVIAR